MVCKMAAFLSRRPAFYTILSGCRYLRSAGSQVILSSTEALSTDDADYCNDGSGVRGNNPMDDMPISELDNPYKKEKRICILCKYPVKLDYKNPKLLSQFVSQFTGQVYGKHITGLCSLQQKRIEHVIDTSRLAGYMPYEYKDVKYLKDPKLFDPSNQPIRKHY